MVKRPKTAKTLQAAETIGAHVGTWRRLQHLTGQQVAERAGISLSTYRKIEKGDLGVAFGSYLDVFRALGQLPRLVDVLDPYETDLGRARADQQLPKRVRHGRD